jgi:hypothetical protein
MNPLAALFFAVEQDWNLNKDPCCTSPYSLVWAVAGNRQPRSEWEGKFKDDVLTGKQWFDSLPDDDAVFVLPDENIPRARAQASIFSLWKDLRKNFLAASKSTEIWRIRILAEQKSVKVSIDGNHVETMTSRRDRIKWSLYSHGITRASLYPDMEGLAAYLTWKHNKVHEAIYQKSAEEFGLPLLKRG